MAETRPGGSRAKKPSTIRIGKRYRPTRVDSDYDAIVVGSGIGGLASAACLSKQGKKVLVLEQHYTAGGFTHSYSRDGYEWDVGVHYIGDMGSPHTLGRKLFDYITDGNLKWASMGETYDCFHLGDEVFELKAGKDGFRESILAAFPGEEKTLDRYLKMLSRVNQAMQFYTLGKLLPRASLPVASRLLKMALPSYFNKTTYEVLRSLTDNEKLIGVLTGQWGDCGMPPKKSSFLIHCLIAKHYLHGGYYPVGGASQMAETIIPVIQQGGGDVMTYADVERILVERKKATGVQMKDGTVIKAPLVISNAGVVNTFEHLLDEKTSDYCGYPKVRRNIRPSMAHLGMYIGLKGTTESLDLPKTNQWIYLSEHHDAEIEAFTKDLNRPLPVVYISFPSAKDPSYQARYPGRSAIEIVAPAPYDQFEKWKDTTWGQRGEDYEALKEELSQQMLEVLYSKFPQLRGKIDYYETSTPLSTDFYCRYSRGEIYGLDHDPLRFEQDWLRPATRVKGLYLTGQDTLSCGVVGAMIAGMITAVSISGIHSVPLLKEMFIEKGKGEWVPLLSKAPA